jgi:hypothetical protein
MKTLIKICLVAFIVTLQQGLADPIPVSITGMVMGEDLGTLSYTPGIQDFQFNEEAKQWELIDPKTISGAWMGSADVTFQELNFDPDPIVYNNLLVSNTSGGTQTYVFNITLPTAWPGGPIRGSIDTSVIGPNALLQAPMGGSVYSAQIDGVTVKTLQDSPFALGTSQSATSQSDSFGFEPNGIAVASDIGIQLTFTLSAGATAAIISDFEVIPEPASAALIGLVCGGGLFIRKRFVMS